MVAAPRETETSEAYDGGELTRIDSPGVIESITRGEVDMQVTTAKRFPRSLKTFKQRALTMATVDQKTAASCFYALPRDGKTIQGPSVRLAEIVASEWGNLRAEYRIVGDDDSFITAQATCWDMERNVLIRCEVRRRISGKNGRRYSDDMIVTTGNAAGKIAFRNAVFSVVPRAFVDDIFAQCRKVAVGDARTISAQRDEWFVYWRKAGIDEARVLAMLGKQSIADVDIDDLATMSGLVTALKDGDTTLDQAFPAVDLKAGTFGFGKKAEQQAQEAETQKTEPAKPAPAAEAKQEATKPAPGKAGF